MERNKTPNQLLLLDDVINLGRKGDLVKAKPGFARNFLIPQKKAVLADKRTIRLQEKLKEERAKQAILDRKESEALAASLKGKTFSTKVKTDKEGHLFGSVSATDIVQILEEEGIQMDRRQVIMAKPIKYVGTFEISLRLKEDVPATFTLKVVSEIQIVALKSQVEVVEEGEVEAEEEALPETAGESLPSMKEQKRSARDELEERSKD